MAAPKFLISSILLIAWRTVSIFCQIHVLIISDLLLFVQLLCFALPTCSKFEPLSPMLVWLARLWVCNGVSGEKINKITDNAITARKLFIFEFVIGKNLITIFAEMRTRTERKEPLEQRMREKGIRVETMLI